MISEGDMSNLLKNQQFQGVRLSQDIIIVENLVMSYKYETDN